MRFLLNLLIAHLAVGLIFIIAFQLIFEYPATVTLLHMLLLFTALTLLLLPCLYLHQRNHSRALLGYVLLTLPVFDFLLIALYSGSLISNSIWAGNITLQLLDAYVADLSVMRQTLPALNLYLGAMLVLLLTLLAGYRYLFNRYYEPDGTGYQPRFLGYSALAMLATAALLQIDFDSEDPGIWAGEPLSNLFLDYIPMFEFDPALPELATRSAVQADTALQNPTATKPNVVIIMVDALRADHLTHYGYQRDTSPFLSALSDEGRLTPVEMVHSSCSESACGILSVLTGYEYEMIRSNSIHLGNILQANGYTSSFLLTGNHAWGGLSTMYDADYLSDGAMRERYAVNDDAGVIAELERLDLAASQPNFLYLHLYSAHDLGLRHRQFNRFEPFQSSFNPLATLFSNEEDRRQQEVNNYDNGILQADFFIAQIFEQLEDKGLLQNSIVYITSDHGQGFGEHGHHGHTRFLYEEHTRIPLLIYDPQRERYQNTQYATHIDIAPTLLDALGIEPIVELPGRSLLESTPINRATRHSSTIPTGWKLHLIKRGELIYKHLWEGSSYAERGTELLFEITQDPLESINLIAAPQSEEVLAISSALLSP